MYLKQVQASQRSNVGITYINGSFNRGAMKGVRIILAVASVLFFVIWVYFLCKNRLEIIPFGICLVCIFLGIATQDNDSKYDPYDISDMD